MTRRLSVIIGLLAGMALTAGCRFGAPMLEDLGGCPGCSASACAPDTKTKAIIRQQARNARHQERFIDTYFLNYDINDPYRGDCLSGW